MSVYEKVASLIDNSIGNGQKWFNVIGSRVQNTSYKNTTGRTMCVQFGFSISTGQNFSFFVDDVTPPINQTGMIYENDSSFASGGTVFLIVPNNHYYMMIRVAGAGFPMQWQELK